VDDGGAAGAMHSWQGQSLRKEVGGQRGVRGSQLLKEDNRAGRVVITHSYPTRTALTRNGSRTTQSRPPCVPLWFNCPDGHPSPPL
jgi:hypothetical protein